MLDSEKQKLIRWGHKSRKADDGGQNNVRVRRIRGFTPSRFNV